MSAQRVLRVLLSVVLPVACPVVGQEALRYEAEDWTAPASAWQVDTCSEDHWNLWSTDRNAHEKWSEGIVLQSPRVLADRQSGDEGPRFCTR